MMDIQTKAQSPTVGAPAEHHIDWLDDRGIRWGMSLSYDIDAPYSVDVKFTKDGEPTSEICLTSFRTAWLIQALTARLNLLNHHDDFEDAPYGPA